MIKLFPWPTTVREALLRNWPTWLVALSFSQAQVVAEVQAEVQHLIEILKNR
jgi:hypothetical protein